MISAAQVAAASRGLPADTRPLDSMRVTIFSLVAMAMLGITPGAMGQAKICPEIDGQQVTVTGVVRNRMVGGQREPGEAPSSYFDLESPEWKCRLERVEVAYPGRVLWCGEGRRVEVSGIYRESSSVFRAYSYIDAMEVRCH